MPTSYPPKFLVVKHERILGTRINEPQRYYDAVYSHADTYPEALKKAAAARDNLKHDPLAVTTQTSFVVYERRAYSED